MDARHEHRHPELVAFVRLFCMARGFAAREAGPDLLEVTWEGQPVRYALASGARPSDAVSASYGSPALEGMFNEGLFSGIGVRGTVAPPADDQVADAVRTATGLPKDAEVAVLGTIPRRLRRFTYRIRLRSGAACEDRLWSIVVDDRGVRLPDLDPGAIAREISLTGSHAHAIEAAHPDVAAEMEDIIAEMRDRLQEAVSARGHRSAEAALKTQHRLVCFCDLDAPLVVCRVGSGKVAQHLFWDAAYQHIRLAVCSLCQREDAEGTLTGGSYLCAGCAASVAPTCAAEAAAIGAGGAARAPEAAAEASGEAPAALAARGEAEAASGDRQPALAGAPALQAERLAGSASGTGESCLPDGSGADSPAHRPESGRTEAASRTGQEAAEAEVRTPGAAEPIAREVGVDARSAPEGSRSHGAPHLRLVREARAAEDRSAQSRHGDRGTVPRKTASAGKESVCPACLHKDERERGTALLACDLCGCRYCDRCLTESRCPACRNRSRIARDVLPEEVIRALPDIRRSRRIEVGIGAGYFVIIGRRLLSRSVGVFDESGRLLQQSLPSRERSVAF